MQLISWSPTLSVGIEEIDKQHKELIRLINELHDAMRAGKGQTSVGPTLAGLINYTVYHFGTEEQLFNETGYPAAKQHLELHKSLTKQVVDIKRRYDAGEPVITIDLMEFLRNWLNDHIKGVDKKYTAHFHSKGIQ
jgi:hemerythrin-like metal-binding protein